MDHGAIIDGLAAFPAMLRPAVAGLSLDDAKRKPASGAWSITEIVAHLADEETLDFRTRLRMTLEEPTKPWPPIDPEGRAAEKCYNERDYNIETARFELERTASLEWLCSFGAVNWSCAHQHPTLGAFRAGDLLASWAAHDMLHLRQIAKHRFELATVHTPEYSTRYAGEWGA